MAKRISQEEIIINYFKTADIAKVEVVFNIVKSELKSRQGSAPKAAKPAKVAKPVAAAKPPKSEKPAESAEEIFG